MTDLTAVDRQARHNVREIEAPPIADRLTDHDAGIPHIAGDHRGRAKSRVVVSQIFENFNRRHAALHRGSDAISASALRQILAEAHRDFGLDPEPAVIPHRQFGAAVAHPRLEDRAVARLASPTHLLFISGPLPGLLSLVLPPPA